MQTVLTTNNAYDSVLLVDSSETVIGAWTVTPAVMESYVRDGADASNWDANYPDATVIADYGTEVGRNGKR